MSKIAHIEVQRERRKMMKLAEMWGVSIAELQGILNRLARVSGATQREVLAQVLRSEGLA